MDNIKTNPKRYFQLTEHILIEYTYNYPGNTEGDENDTIIDIHDHPISITTNEDNNTRYMYFNSENDTEFNTKKRSVISLNSNGSKFIRMYNDKSERWYDEMGVNSSVSTETPTTFTEDEGDIYFDTCKVHFTSGNYMNNYDYLIFQSKVKDLDGGDICLTSFILTKTDDVELNVTPILINQKLYTTHISFKIPSTKYLTSGIANSKYLVNKLSKYHKFQKNTPIELSIHGVRSSYMESGFMLMNTEELNTISIPSYDTFSSLSIDIQPATDGDYFKIRAVVRKNQNSTTSFANYMREIDENPENYIVMHEISLLETYMIDSISTEPNTIQTHLEYYIANMAYDDNESINDYITYRPVCMYSNNLIHFTIKDTLKIINTEDNTTIIKTSSYTSNDSEKNKYGKKMQNIFSTHTTPLNVNVYNKRMDEELDYVNITNSGGVSTNIENHQYNISALVECTNIGVSIQQVSTQDIE